MDGITQVISGGKDGVETFKKSIQDIVEVIKQGDALKGVTEMISGLSSLLVEAIKGFIQALPSLLAEIPTLVGDLLDSVLDLIEEVNWGEVFLGILNAALGVIGTIFQTLTDHQTEATEEWARHRDAIYEYIAAGEEALAAAQALSDQREEAYDSLYAEIGLMEDIKGKLIEYTDEQGHVKEGYEDDLAALVALADAQGIHIEVIDGEIQYYQDLITSIDDAIEKLREYRYVSGKSRIE